VSCCLLPQGGVSCEIMCTCTSCVLAGSGECAVPCKRLKSWNQSKPISFFLFLFFCLFPSAPPFFFSFPFPFPVSSLASIGLGVSLIQQSLVQLCALRAAPGTPTRNRQSLFCSLQCNRAVCRALYQYSTAHTMYYKLDLNLMHVLACLGVGT
jgi:hypothetical protein